MSQKASGARTFFEETGYYVARQLFSTAETDEIREHFMELRKRGPAPGDAGGDPEKGEADPLNAYPRFINTHQWDEKSEVWQRDPRLTETAST
ncbi:MAG: phytanoyl-CoA dioxygenase family protein, partial [Chloroflexi bacterium]|nr:phytanoyl-CoA dioxygenase family protein [Chloroflexota bacterium]